MNVFFDIDIWNDNESFQFTPNNTCLTQKKEEEENYSNIQKNNHNTQNYKIKEGNTRSTNDEENVMDNELQKHDKEALNVKEEEENSFQNLNSEKDCFIIPEEEKYFEEIKESKNNPMPLGKKRGRNNTGEGEHNKFSDDNLRRKCKHLVLKSLFNYINKNLKKIYKNIGYGIFKKQLLTINQKQKSNATVLFNRDFLNKTIGDIFSEDISNRYTTYMPTHNKDLINFLKNEENSNIAQYFKNLFNLRFIDCLKHFRGTQKFDLLEGLEGFDSIKEKYENDKDYLKSLNYYIMNYEDIINNKRIRKGKSKI